MTLTREEDKPWKTDLARKAAQRRERVAQELEELIREGALVRGCATPVG